MSFSLGEGGGDTAREIKLKTFKGASAMFVRQMVIMALNFFCGIILSRKLSPADFGVYVVSTFVVNTLGLFTDVGLGSALIQRKEEPELRHYRTIFTFQFALILLVVTGIFFLAPVFVNIYHAQQGVVWYLRVISLTLLISSIGSVSVIKLERRLAYNAFARIDVVTAIVDKSVAVSLAMLGYGYWSFLVAVVCSSLVRVAVTFRAAPWHIGFAMDKPFLKSSIKFGGLFQLAGLTSLFRDNLNALLVGPRFGPNAVGYLNWSHNIAYQGSQIFTQIVNRINFPSLSRVQNEPAVLSDIVSRTLRLLNVLTIPILLTAMALIHEIVAIVYTSKWDVAIPAFYCYALLMIGGNFTTTLSGFLLATDQAKNNLKIMTVWTILVWVFAIILTPIYGYIGAALSPVVAVIIVSIWLIKLCKKRIDINMFDIFFKPLFSGLLGAMLIF